MAKAFHILRHVHYLLKILVLSAVEYWIVYNDAVNILVRICGQNRFFYFFPRYLAKAITKPTAKMEEKESCMLVPGSDSTERKESGKGGNQKGLVLQTDRLQSFCSLFLTSLLGPFCIHMGSGIIICQEAHQMRAFFQCLQALMDFTE